MYAVVRLRGSIKISKEAKDTMNMMRLNRVNTLSILPDDAVSIGMIKKVNDFVAWGTVSDDVLQKVGNKKGIRLKSPRGGLKSVKVHYPKGSIGYNGDAINVLIRKMI